MRTQLIIFGFLTLFFTSSQANQDIPSKSVMPDISQATMLNATKELDGHDGFMPKIAVYALIVSVYGLYWWRQKA